MENLTHYNSRPTAWSTAGWPALVCCEQCIVEKNAQIDHNSREDKNITRCYERASCLVVAGRMFAFTRSLPNFKQTWVSNGVNVPHFLLQGKTLRLNRPPLFWEIMQLAQSKKDCFLPSHGWSASWHQTRAGWLIYWYPEGKITSLTR